MDRTRYMALYYRKNREYLLSVAKKRNKNNRESLTEYRKKYRATLEGKEATKRAVKRYELKNKEKKKAWGRVNRIGCQPCIVCGKIPSHKHHPKYTKPLEIVFLCPLHHKQWHGNKV